MYVVIIRPCIRRIREVPFPHVYISKLLLLKLKPQKTQQQTTSLLKNR